MVPVPVNTDPGNKSFCFIFVKQLKIKKIREIRALIENKHLHTMLSHHGSWKRWSSKARSRVSLNWECCRRGPKCRVIHFRCASGVQPMQLNGKNGTAPFKGSLPVDNAQIRIPYLSYCSRNLAQKYKHFFPTEIPSNNQEKISGFFR